MRALRDYTLKCENASRISTLLSAKVNEIAPAVEHLQDEADALKARVARLETELFESRARQMAGADVYKRQFGSTAVPPAATHCPQCIRWYCAAYAAPSDSC